MVKIEEIDGIVGVSVTLYVMSSAELPSTLHYSLSHEFYI